MLRGILTLAIAIFFFLSSPLSAWAEPAQTQTQQQLNELADLAFAATNKGDFATAETYWTKTIEQFPDNAAVWSNRGNARISQNKLEEAIADYDKSTELAPSAPEPYLNRGIAWEGLKQWDKAIADYNHVLEIDASDAAAYNNRGSAKGGSGDWQGAIADYKKATELASDFAFASGNYALALYQVGETQEAEKKMRALLRKYPNFVDMRAALTAALWQDRKRGEAKSNWVSVGSIDPRYKDIDWVANIRRWPPAITSALAGFLKVQ